MLILLFLILQWWSVSGRVSRKNGWSLWFWPTCLSSNPVTSRPRWSTWVSCRRSCAHHRTWPALRGKQAASVLRPHPPRNLPRGPREPRALAQPPGGAGGRPRSRGLSWARAFLSSRAASAPLPPPPALRVGRPSQRLAELQRLWAGKLAAAATGLRKRAPLTVPIILRALHYQCCRYRQWDQHKWVGYSSLSA